MPHLPLSVLSFVSTYLCESVFSTLTSIKTKYHASIKDIETVMRPALTNIEQRFDLLCKNMQNHASHWIARFVDLCKYRYLFAFLFGVTVHCDKFSKLKRKKKKSQENFCHLERGRTQKILGSPGLRHALMHYEYDADMWMYKTDPGFLLCTRCFQPHQWYIFSV